VFVTNLAVRTALVAFAALVLASFAFGLRSVVLEDRAEAVIDRARAGTASGEDIRQARDWLDDAARLNADRAPDIKKARLLYLTDQDREALALAKRVLADEPENLEAWYLVYATDYVPARRNAALAEMRHLNPYIEVLLGRRECIDCPLRRGN
jgi:hypothetical protein